MTPLEFRLALVLDELVDDGGWSRLAEVLRTSLAEHADEQALSRIVRDLELEASVKREYQAVWS